MLGSYNAWPGFPGTQSQLTPPIAYAALPDADFSALPWHRIIVTGTPLTAARTLFLPPASSVPPGHILGISDAANTITGTNTLTIAVAVGSFDAIVGYNIMAKNEQSLICVSDGVRTWSISYSGNLSDPLSVIGRNVNTTGNIADISATPGSAAVLRESGSAIGFGTVATAGIADNAITTIKIASSTGAGDGVTNSKLRQSGALSVIGRSSNTTGAPADIAATAASGAVLRESGSVLAFGTITAAATNFAATARLHGRVTAGAGAGEEVTAANLLATFGTVLNNTTTTITVGYTLTPNSIGTMAATFTPNPALGNYQYATNNNAVTTFNVPSSDCAIDILITNGASAGAITFSGYQIGSNTGDTYSTTSGNDFILSIRRINALSTYVWKALQ
jgi:hypothetical protein